LLGQMQMTPDGRIRDKVETAIQRLKTFEPEEGYYVAFSGGKDSQCVYHLCKMAGVKFDAHYAVTSVDPPELVRFIKKNYPDVKFERQHDKDGKPITMWNLIAANNIPPTRKVRYCCANLKEPGGVGRLTVTGVRWAESINRKKTHDVVDFRGKKKGTIKLAEDIGAEYKLNKHGEVIMNDDNDENRRMVEQCYRTRKTMINPIVDWTNEDVWGFLNENEIPHCNLYDEGFERLGCIGCPLSGSRNMIRDFERWPKYKTLYIHAFQRMIDNHPGKIRMLTDDTKYGIYDAQREFEDSGILPVSEEMRGGVRTRYGNVLQVDQGKFVLMPSCGSGLTPMEICRDGSCSGTWTEAAYSSENMFYWFTVGGENGTSRINPIKGDI